MIEVILDASQIETFETCAQKWFKSYIQNLEPKKAFRAQSTGSYYHEVLAHYYGLYLPSSDILSTEDRMRSAMKFATQSDLLKKFHITKQEDIEFHVNRLLYYLNFNSVEDEQTTIIAVEQGFSYLLYEDATRRYIAEGKIDIVGRRKELGLFVQDHKTQSRKDDRYPYNHQVMNYLNFTGADYFEYNYIGLQDKLPPKGLRRNIYRPPPGVMEQWKADTIKTFDEMASILYAGRRTNEVLEGGLYMYHNDYTPREEMFPRRRTACDASKYGTCQYHKICEVPDNSEFVQIVKNHYKVKDEKWRAWS